MGSTVAAHESPAGCDFLLQTPTTAFAPEDFSSDEQMMCDVAAQFSYKDVLPVVERLDAQEPGLMPSLIRKAGELGLCGMDTSEKYGGLGQSKNLAARALEFLSLNGSFSVTIGVTSGISQVGLALFGQESLREKYLPALASGEQIGAYCLSEPNSGTDALSMTTRADLQGGEWVLNGTKMWISNAQWAEQFLVMAKVGGEKVTAFIVERGFPGVQIAREEHKMGLKGSSTARVILDNARVPAENMLFEEGRGHVVAFNALNLGRFKLASMSLGPARAAMRYAAEYAHDRKQFGQPIAGFGLIQKKFAEMAARYFAAESMIYRTGALIDHAFAASRSLGDLSEIQQNQKAAEAYSVECSVCKVSASETEAFIVDEAFQVYGGYGFTEEFPIARIYRDARIARIYEGTNEINRFFIADRILRKLKSGELALPSSSDSFVGELLAKGLAAVVDRGLNDQISLGALADLVILHYSEQSARLRVSRSTRFAPLHQLYVNWANTQAGLAYQTLTQEAVTLPAAHAVDMGAVAMLLFESQGPVLG